MCRNVWKEAPRSTCETPSKVVENDQARIMWDFQIQTDTLVTANQLDIGVVDKRQKKAVVTDVAIPSDSNIWKKEHNNFERNQGLEEGLLYMYMYLI